MIVDFRSDTLTRPTKDMLAAMMAAPVGDDVYGEDPSINALEARLAQMFGFDSALFCPSGTMCNQIAIRISTQPQDQVICDRRSHIYLYEGGGIAANSLATVRLLDGPHGILSPEMVETAINPDDQHFPVSRLLALENTCNMGGGSIYQMGQISALTEIARSHDLRMHLDGARLFNAIVAADQDTSSYGQYFDTISICLSKGLGAPVGSVLLCDAADYPKARRVRKMMGGGMRQAGYLAAAGLYAIENHVARLKKDHQRAEALVLLLERLGWVKDTMPCESNIVGFLPDPTAGTYQDVIQKLEAQGILASGFGTGYVRLVTHLDIDDRGIEKTLSALSTLF
ncbi:MAG: GntG family PLP-dependent aldolase [Bacteroidota bacterium]